MSSTESWTRSAFCPTLVDLVSAWGGRTPNQPAIITEGGSVLSYGELNDEVDRASRMLRARFALPTRIAVCMRNSHHWAVVALAVKRAGHTLVAINDRYDLTTITDLLNRTATQGFITDRSEGPSGWIADRTLVPEHGNIFFLPSQASGLELGRQLPEEATIVFTSGTSAKAKGVVLSHANEVLGGLLLNYETGLTRTDVFLITTPFSHRPGQMRLFVALAAGATVVIAQKYDPTRIPDLVDSYGVTTIGAVPTSLRDIITILRRSGRKLDSVRTVHVAGDAFPGEILSAFRGTFPNAQLYAHYSSSEAGYITHAEIDSLVKDPKSVGTPRPGVQIAIHRQDGYLAEIGEEGEIWVRSGALGSHTTSLAYVDAESGELDEGDGWVRTGDLGSLTAENTLKISGRIKNIVISGGMNISLTEVEEAIGDILEGASYVCAGIPDVRLGQKLVCVVEGELPASEESILEAMRVRLPSYKMPRAIRAIPRIPRTPTGKIQRREIATIWKEDN